MNNKHDAQLKHQPGTCPRCNGPMPSPISVTELQPNGVPRSTYVCRHCHRLWLAQQKERVKTIRHSHLQEES